MRIHEALLYLPQRKLDPLTVIECQASGCDRDIQLAQAVAFPARIVHWGSFGVKSASRRGSVSCRQGLAFLTALTFSSSGCSAERACLRD
jgi:hypothetical protein